MSAAIQLDQIKPARRKDLRIVCRDRDAERADWVVKDPLQLNYFFLDSFQHWLFERLDGTRSLREIRDAFNQNHAPRKLTESQLLSFCIRLSRDGLLCENVTGEQLAERRQQKKKFNWLRAPMSLLSLRLPGLNAGWAIDMAETVGSWIFSPVAVFLFFVWFLFAGLFGIQSLDQLIWAMPTLGSVGAQDVVLLLVCISFVKIVHELAHAVCCRRMGADCDEIGVMFLVFSPCLYCNVSDSWMLPSRWRRIAIALAGIYVELIIASGALFLWYFVEGEILKSLFLNLLIVCSVSTLLVNGNPLMRYDGYFVLSDLLGVPNLGQQSRKTAWRWISKLFFVAPQQVELPRENLTTALLLIYYFASSLYRVLIMAVIGWVFYAMLKPLGLSAVVVALMVFYAGSMFIGFLFSAVPMMKESSRRGRKNWIGILVSLLIGAGLIYFVGQIKVPQVVKTDAVIQLSAIYPCAAQATGVLEWTVAEGDKVKAGDVLARLSDPNLELKKIELAGEIESAKLQIENLKSRASVEPKTRVALPSVEAELRGLEREMAQLKKRFAALEIRASQSGTVMAGTSQPVLASSEVELGSWEDNLLSPKNIGCTVKEGDVVCAICRPDDWKAVLVVDQRKLDLISRDNPIAFRTSMERDKTYRGTLTDVSSEVIQDDESTANSERAYRAEMALDKPLSIGMHGATAKARVTVAEQTLFEIGKRFLIESFRFDLKL